MHQAQASQTTSVSASENCGLDVKPSLSNGGGGQSSVPKQREGTNSLVNSNSSGTGSGNTGASGQGSNGGGGGSLNGGLFDVGQHPSYNGYENGGYGGSGGGAGGGAGYGNHQSQSNAFQSSAGTKMSGGGGGGGGMNSPHSKTQRTKSRTNAGKTVLRHGVGYS